MIGHVEGSTTTKNRTTTVYVCYQFVELTVKYNIYIYIYNNNTSLNTSLLRSCCPNVSYNVHVLTGRQVVLPLYAKIITWQYVLQHQVATENLQ